MTQLKKLIASVVLGLTFGLSLALQPMLASENTLSLNKKLSVITEDGALSFSDNMGYPASYKGRTYVPLAVLARHFNYQVQAFGNFVAVKDEKGLEIILSNNDFIASVNGEDVPLDVRNGKIQKETTATIFKGRTYVPLRFICEQFNLDVSDNGGKVILTQRETNDATHESTK